MSAGLKANNSEQRLAGLKAQIETLQANLKAIGEAKKGDAIHFEFTPEAGTRIVVNGRQKGGVIPGDDLFTAVLRVWIGDAPVDAALRKELVDSWLHGREAAAGPHRLRVADHHQLPGRVPSTARLSSRSSRPPSAPRRLR